MGHNLSAAGTFGMERLDIHRLDISFFSIDRRSCNNILPCSPAGTRRHKKNPSSANCETLVNHLRTRIFSCWISLFQLFHNTNYGGSSANRSMLFRCVNSRPLYKKCTGSNMLAGRTSHFVLAHDEVHTPPTNTHAPTSYV